MNLTLLKMWNGLPIGFQLVGVQVGQAELMVRYGTAIATKTEPIEPPKQQQPQQQRRRQ
jgi:hypothetical protein